MHTCEIKIDGLLVTVTTKRLTYTFEVGKDYRPTDPSDRKRVGVGQPVRVVAIFDAGRVVKLSRGGGARHTMSNVLSFCGTYAVGKEYRFPRRERGSLAAVQSTGDGRIDALERRVEELAASIATLHKWCTTATEMYCRVSDNLDSLAARLGERPMLSKLPPIVLTNGAPK